MSDDSPRPDLSDIPEAVARPKRRFSFQLVWIIPIVAALIGITLAVRAYIERGQAITITFVTGEGAHHTYFEAEERGLNVLYAGHYATETLGVTALAAHLAERFELETFFIEHPTGL